MSLINKIPHTMQAIGLVALLQGCTSNSGPAPDMNPYTTTMDSHSTIMDSATTSPDTADTATQYTPQATDLSEILKLHSPNSEYDAFGLSVAISRDYAIIGAPFTFKEENGEPIYEAGAAYIFNRDGDTWVQVAELEASKSREFGWFGTSVDIEGNYAVVGSYGQRMNEDNSLEHSGDVYVFERTDNGWERMIKIGSDNPEEPDSFGEQVAISEKYVVIGAPRDDGIRLNGGSVHVFEIGGAWENEKLFSFDTYDHDKFGSAVDISGDYIIIGAPGNDNGDFSEQDSGVAYIFERRNGAWQQEARVTARDGVGGDEFGTSVAISQNNAIVGAYKANDFAGAAYIFQRKPEGLWTPKGELIPNYAEPNASLGWSVALENNTAVVGTDGADTAYVFKDRENSGTWTQSNTLRPSDDAATFGWAVGISDNTVIVGAPFTNPAAAYFFDMQ